MQIDKIYEEKNHGSTHTNGDSRIIFINNCDDEEDCIQGSGSGDGGTGGSNLYPGPPSSKNGENNQAKNNEEVFNYPGGTDKSTSGTESKFVPMSCYCLLCYCSTVLLLSLLCLQNYSDQIT
jgi:hypothetical protein